MFELSAYVHSRRLQSHGHGIVEETVTSIGPSMASICIRPSILGPCAIVVFIWCSLFVSIYMLLMTLEISGTASQQKDSYILPTDFLGCIYDRYITVYILFDMHFLVENKFQSLLKWIKLLQNFCGFCWGSTFWKKVDVFSFLLFTLLLNKHNHRKSLINIIKKCSFFVVMLVYRL